MCWGQKFLLPDPCWVWCPWKLPFFGLGNLPSETLGECKNFVKSYINSWVYFSQRIKLRFVKKVPYWTQWALKNLILNKVPFWTQKALKNLLKINVDLWKRFTTEHSRPSPNYCYFVQEVSSWTQWALRNLSPRTGPLTEYSKPRNF